MYSYLSLFLLCLKYNPIKVNDNDIKSLIERIILGLGDCNNSHIVINSIECLNSCLLLFSDNNSILIKSYPTIITSLLEHTQKISFFLIYLYIISFISSFYQSFKVAIASSETINSFLLYFSKQSTIPSCIIQSLDNICNAIKTQLLNENSLADYKSSLLQIVVYIYINIIIYRILYIIIIINMLKNKLKISLIYY